MSSSKIGSLAGSPTLVGRFKDCPSKIETRLAKSLPDETWLGLLLPEVGTEVGNLLGKVSIVDFGGGLHCQVLEQDQRIPRLWKLRFSKSGTEFLDLVYRIGQPIRYRYRSALWRLGYYQNVYALQPGAAEMPSAGRAFSWRLLLQLRKSRRRKGLHRLYIRDCLLTWMTRYATH